MAGTIIQLVAVLVVVWSAAAIAASPSEPSVEPPPEEPSVSVEIVVTTPGRLEQGAGDVTGSTSVLTEPAIAIQQPIVVPDVLRDLPGLDTRQAGTIGETASIRIRGAEPFQNLVLLDGVRINSPFRGYADLGDFLIDGVDQIEVVRGAYSALYGTDAIGGVVNLRMLPPQRPLEVMLFAGGGTFQTAREGVSVAGKRGWGHYRLQLSRTDSDGQFDNDRFGATTLTGQLRFDLTARSYVMVTPRYQYSEKELALTALEFLTPFAVVWDDNSHLKRQFVSAVVEYRNEIQPWWELVLSGSTVQTDLDWDNPTTWSMLNHNTVVAFSYFEETREREWTVNLQQNFTWAEQQVFTLGLEQGWVDVHSNLEIEFMIDPPGPPPVTLPDVINGRRRTRALYAQQLLTAQDSVMVGDRALLQVGVRADGDTEFGSTANPRVAASYLFPQTHTTFRGGWGMAYRAPTIQDLEFLFFANPALQPETAQSWEAGLQQSLGDGFVVIDAAFFQIDFDDLIQVVFPPPPTPPTKENVGTARSRGIETELTVQPITQAYLAVNYTWLDTRAEGGEEFPLSRRHHLNVSLTGSPLVNLEIRVDVNYVSGAKLPIAFQSPDGSIESGRSPGFVLVDLAVSYELLDRLSPVRRLALFAKATNLLNEEYQDLPGFPAPGLSLFAGVKGYL